MEHGTQGIPLDMAPAVFGEQPQPVLRNPYFRSELEGLDALVAYSEGPETVEAILLV